MQRNEVADHELAQRINVRRETVQRWLKGEVSRPRQREDVLRCATYLSLTVTEREALLKAAGFTTMRRPTPRITSYNVCYTKLLRPASIRSFVCSRRSLIAHRFHRFRNGAAVPVADHVLFFRRLGQGRVEFGAYYHS